VRWLTLGDMIYGWLAGCLPAQASTTTTPLHVRYGPKRTFVSAPRFRSEESFTSFSVRSSSRLDACRNRPGATRSAAPAGARPLERAWYCRAALLSPRPQRSLWISCACWQPQQVMRQKPQRETVEQVSSYAPLGQCGPYQIDNAIISHAACFAIGCSQLSGTASNRRNMAESESPSYGRLSGVKADITNSWSIFLGPKRQTPRVNFCAGEVAYARSESLAAFLAQ
jgi:hypothetical protein